MANLNKVMLIGRLTRDPERIEIRGATQGAKFGFAVNNRRMNPDTKQWEDVPVFIDMEIWNRGENGQQATRVLETLRKGAQVYIEGHLKFDQWTEAPDKGGAKRSRLMVVVDNFQYLDARQDGGDGEEGSSGRSFNRAPARAAASSSRSSDEYDAPARGGNGGRGAPAEQNDDDIPF
jgi:single-strand DNA-binding protein